MLQKRYPIDGSVNGNSLEELRQEVCGHLLDVEVDDQLVLGIQKLPAFDRRLGGHEAQDGRADLAFGPLGRLAMDLGPEEG